MTSRAPKKDDFDPKVPHERKEPRPDFSVQPPSKPLPQDLQMTIDDEGLWESVYDGT
jgi:fission process protein 1